MKGRTSGNICLQEHLARGHEEGVGIGVETGRVNHELHDGCVAEGREEFISRVVVRLTVYISSPLVSTNL